MSDIRFFVDNHLSMADLYDKVATVGVQTFLDTIQGSRTAFGKSAPPSLPPSHTNQPLPPPSNPHSPPPHCQPPRSPPPLQTHRRQHHQPSNPDARSNARRTPQIR